MNESYDLLETSRGPEARQREGALEVSVFFYVCGACYSVRRKNSQNNGYFCSKIEASRSDAIEDRGAIEASRASRASRSDAIEDREAIEASRSDVIEDRGAIEASRSDAPGASQMMTRRGG